MRHPSLPAAVLAATLALGLTACAGDEPATPSEDAAVDVEDGEEDADGEAGAATDEAAADDETADDDAATDTGDGDDALDDAGSGVLVQFRGEQLTAGQDSTMWSCTTSGDGEFAAVMFLDDAGNDVSINYDANGATTASLTLTDGTTWNATEGGVATASQQGDGTYRMSIQLTEVDTGESESMDVRLTC